MNSIDLMAIVPYFITLATMFAEKEQDSHKVGNNLPEDLRGWARISDKKEKLVVIINFLLYLVCQRKAISSNVFGNFTSYSISESISNI